MSQTKPISYIYNPDNQSAEELIAGFVVRTSEFEEIFEDIRTSKMNGPEQGYLILGPRGSGKTTLLLRLMHEIEQDPDLSGWLIPVRFSEEQYDVRKLERLWKKTIEYLDERGKIPGVLDELEQLETLRYSESYEQAALSILISSLKASKEKIILFIDNLGDILDKFDDLDQKRFREVLLTVPEIRVIGASSRNLEHTYDYSKPLYDFFKKVYLGGLTHDETITLLRTLAKLHRSESVNQIIEREPERIEALRQLAGGVPRTIVLLFEIFSDEQNGSAIGDLEQLLDAVTPLYKHRMDDLSAQQQTLVDALAITWDAMSAKEIAINVRMQSKAVSAQLRELENQGLIHTIETKTKNNLYQITERFFNIWYLMRNGSRRDKMKVKWLVRFLECWCSKEDIVERAAKHLLAIRGRTFHPKYGAYLTQALIETGKVPLSIGDDLVKSTRSWLKESGESYLVNTLGMSDMEIIDQALGSAELHNPEAIITKLRRMSSKDGSKEMLIGLIYYSFSEDYTKAREYFHKGAELGRVDGLNMIGHIYENKLVDHLLAERYYKEAASKGDKQALDNLGRLYEKKFKNYELAEAYYEQAINNGYNESLFHLGYLYDKQLNNYEKAEAFYLRSVATGSLEAMNKIGNLYQRHFRKLEKAEMYYLMAAEKDDITAIKNLAVLYDEQRNFPRCEEFALKAIGKNDIESMFFLSVVYYENQAKREDALKFCRQAIELGLGKRIAQSGVLEADLVEIALRSTYIWLLIWNDKFSESLDSFGQLMSEAKLGDEINLGWITVVFKFLLAKRQYHIALNLFDGDEFKAYNFKERIKPMYYVLMYYMKEEFPNEYLRMGSELKETVEQAIAIVEKMRIDYA